MPLLLPLLLAALLLRATAAQAPSPLPRYVRGRLFSASRSAPFARALSRSRAYRGAAALVSAFLRTQDAALRDALTLARNASSSTPPPLRVCNYPHGLWTSASSNYMANRGWRVQDRRDCVTDVHDTPVRPADPRFSSTALFAALQDMYHSIDASAPAIIAASIRNWSTPHQVAYFPFARGSQMCRITHLAAFRLGGHWHLTAGLTNQPRDHWVPDGQRKYLGEFLRVQDQPPYLVPARMTLPLNPGSGTAHHVVTDATTSIATWQGAPHPSQFHSVNLEDNLALQAALDASDHHVRQLDDAVTPSNIAILALPLVLCLLPIALFADVRPKAMLLYAMLSDVLTALPMAIKGAELLSISKRRFAAHVTRLGDTSSSNEISVAAELWVCVCRTRADTRPTGVAFVSVAIVTMVTGLVLEVVARRWMRRCPVLGKLVAVRQGFEDFRENEMVKDALAELSNNPKGKPHRGSQGASWWTEEFGSTLTEELDEECVQVAPGSSTGNKRI